MIYLSKFLWKKLVIPLSIAAVLTILLAYFFPWRGLFINLTVMFIGILLIVCYVDFILKQHEKSRWAQAKALIEKRIHSFANVSSSQFRTAFKISHHVFNEKAMDMENPSSIRKEMIRITQDIILPSADSSVQKLNTEDWKKLVSQLRITWEAADRLCSVFGNRIEPDKLSLIMEIQDEIWGILSLYSTFPDVIGVPDDELPPKKTGSAIAHKRTMERIISSDIKTILEKTILLLKKLDV